MLLFAFPLVAIIAALIFGAAFVFIRKPSERPNRFGSETATRSPVNAVGVGLKRIFDFQGRASRTDFWIFALFVVVTTGLVLIIPIGQVSMTFVLSANSSNAALPSSFNSSNIAWLLTVLAVTSIVLLILALASFSMAVRRLHDINRSGWWILLLCVFGYFVLLYWFLQPSQKDVTELF